MGVRAATCGPEADSRCASGKPIMHSRERALQVYQDLADSFEQQKNPGMRDMFLMLAADAALRAGHTAEAELLRVRLLRLNPDHLLKPYVSFAEAATAPDIQSYLDELRQKYPVEAAEDMLESVLFQTALDVPGDVAATLPPTPRAPASRPADSAGPASRSRPEPPQPPAAEEDSLKVYRVHPEVEPPKPPPATQRPRDVERPVPKGPPPRPAPSRSIEETLPPHAAFPSIGETLPPPRAPAPRPVSAPVPRPPAAPPRPAPSRRPVSPAPPSQVPRGRAAARPAENEEKQTTGAWVGLTLFGLMAVAGLALTLLALFPHILPDALFRK